MAERVLVSPWVPAAASVAAALALVGPWARSGTVDRSSIELLASAGALDVLSNRDHVIAVGSWYLVVLLAAGALLGAAWDRRRLTAVLVIPIGPAMAVAWWIVAAAPLTVRWGAPVGTMLGLTATGAGVLLLMESTVQAEGRR